MSIEGFSVPSPQSRSFVRLGGGTALKGGLVKFCRATKGDTPLETPAKKGMPYRMYGDLHVRCFGRFAETRRPKSAKRTLGVPASYGAATNLSDCVPISSAPALYASTWSAGTFMVPAVSLSQEKKASSKGFLPP